MTERKVWFITRPERDPHFHADAVKALAEATENFTIKWLGNREAHKHYEKVLASRGLKRNNISNDGSGGRTWCAMLKTFAYCYIDGEGLVKPTKSGKALINGTKEYENVKKQILTLQIPNAYFMEAGFRPKFEAGFRIRPARFLIKLVQRPDLQYHLTKEEITYFVLTAQHDKQLDEVAARIIAYRNAGQDEQRLMKQEVAVEYDHRARNDNAARDYYQAHSDVAHTFMLLCEYTALVEYQRGEAVLKTDPTLVGEAQNVLSYYDSRYPFNARYLISVERMAQNSGLDVDSYKASNLGVVKPASNQGKIQGKIEAILNDIPNSTEMTREELLPYFVPSFGPRNAQKVVDGIRFQVREMGSVPEAFVEKYLGELTPAEFEKETLKIFEAIGFEAVYQPKVDGKKTEIEILLTHEDKCGIIDTKHYPSGFVLTQNLANYMASEYIPNYLQFENRQLFFYGYVTSSKFSEQKKLKSITTLSSKLVEREIEGFMMTREVLIGFLDYCIENELSKKERVELFLARIQNKGFSDLQVFLTNKN
ncbi:AlwI family type II restriction endonuclease [Bacillus atrophaeus]|uniref:AlwI family type II restriction endonuclease n=1 Tax=Bacillus atrophaeus TaxID=1452 RepID=UPI0022821FFE|nr:AlwI family type II restriction endonuclease [Bacillus atrophaeus]MCY8466768.1 AlwI family type II restriction endonuclease [Bacillus atrophaeus]MCY8479716.1 AlwI family type II restriction endonuclease [Bacillus atrophaeus]